MRKTILPLVIIVTGAFFLSGCSRPAAVVNGKKIDRKMFEMLLQERSQSHKDQNVAPDMKKLSDAVIQELISEQLILEASDAEGIRIADNEVIDEIDAIKKNMGGDAFNKSMKDKGMTPDSLKKRIREKLTMTRFIQNLVRNEDVTQEEITDYYHNSPRPFIKPGRVLMKMIEVSSEDAALGIAEEMKNSPAGFDAVAAKLAEENRAVVSDYGWVRPDFFSPAISEAIRDIKEGDFGGPYKGQKNYFFVRIKEKEKETVAKFDEMKDSIRNMLLEQKRQAALAHWLAQKKKEATIEVFIK